MNTTASHRFATASRYIETIRNRAKRGYAHEYYQWIREGRPESKRPVYGDNLSYMGAQAVRMYLDEILGD